VFLYLLIDGHPPHVPMTTGYGRHETQMVEVVMDEKGSDRATFSVVIERDNASLTRRQSELSVESTLPSSGNSLAVNVGPRYFKFRNDVTRGGGRTPELLLNTRPSGRAEDLEEDQTLALYAAASSWSLPRLVVVVAPVAVVVVVPH